MVARAAYDKEVRLASLLECLLDILDLAEDLSLVFFGGDAKFLQDLSQAALIHDLTACCEVSRCFIVDEESAPLVAWMLVSVSVLRYIVWGRMENGTFR